MSVEQSWALDAGLEKVHGWVIGLWRNWCGADSHLWGFDFVRGGEIIYDTFVVVFW